MRPTVSELADSKSKGADMKSFEELLETSVERHGHLCPGQVVGVRMAMLGCRLIGLDDPSSREQVKKLLVYVEMDRCTADAVALVTGAKLGRRSLKFMDYGIMAATFVNPLRCALAARSRLRRGQAPQDRARQHRHHDPLLGVDRDIRLVRLARRRAR